MNCPKCGGELIINSNVCPNCDVVSEEMQVPTQKKKRSLTRLGKLWIALLCLAAILTGTIVSVVHFSRIKIYPAANGNRLNYSLICETNSGFYYSDLKALYWSNKSFSEYEKIDESANGLIANITECNACIFYTKDNGIYQYNPRTRKKSAVAAIKGECAVVGKSFYDIYYSYENSLYKLSARDASFVRLADGIPVIDENGFYICQAGTIYKSDFETLAKEKIASVSNYASPVFVKDGKIFCYDYKELKIFSVAIEDGVIQDEFKSDEHDNISDVAHMNISGNYLFLRGENGIYRYDLDTDETLCMKAPGYVEYMSVYSGGLYTVSPDGKSFFIDFNGNIIKEITES